MIFSKLTPALFFNIIGKHVASAALDTDSVHFTACLLLLDNLLNICKFWLNISTQLMWLILFSDPRHYYYTLYVFCFFFVSPLHEIL